MSNLILKDSTDIHDNIIIKNESHYMTPKKTKIMIYDDDGNLLGENTNKMLVTGSQFSACSQFDIDPLIVFPNYNNDLGIDNTLNNNVNSKNCICLFACGTSGCGIKASEVYPVDFTKRIAPENLIPFRYEKTANDLSKAQRDVYFGRKPIPAEDRVAYYYKAFDSKPQLHIQYADGTEIDQNVYNNTTTQNAIVYVETRLRVTKTDFRDWFFQKDGIENARINTLSLLTAWYHLGDDEIKYYQDVIPDTQLNFSNEWLVDLTKGVNIVYQVFY